MAIDDGASKQPCDFATAEDLRCAIPRRVKYTARTLWIRRGVWNFALAVACLVSICALRSIADLTTLARYGRFVNAYVVTSVKLDIAGPCFYYGYSSDRHSPKEDGHIIVRAEKDEEPLETWDPIQFTYLPSNPHHYVFGPVVDRQIAALRSHWVRVAISWSIPFLIWIVRLEILISRQRRLLRYGRAVSATLASKVHVQTADLSDRYFHFSYSSNEAEYKGWASGIPQKSYERYSEGECFTLVVDHKNPFCYLPYLRFTDVMLEGSPDLSFGT